MLFVEALAFAGTRNSGKLRHARVKLVILIICVIGRYSLISLPSLLPKSFDLISLRKVRSLRKLEGNICLISCLSSGYLEVAKFVV